MRAVCVCVAGAVIVAMLTSATHADDFYAGRTVTLLVGNNAGTAYDASARLVARHFGRHISGKPTFIVQNMPGATGLTAANYVWRVAAKDGSVIANAHESLPLRQLLGDPAVQYDATKLQWIGSPEASNQTIAVWHTAKVATIDDAKAREVLMGGTTASADSSIVLNLSNRFIGTKFKVILGYQANQIDLAIERGEVQGRAVIWNGLKATKADWLRDNKVALIAQLGLHPEPELADVPLLQDLASDHEGKLIIQLFSAQLALGRPLYVPPGVPASRVAELRDAFERMVASPEFLDDAQRTNYQVRLVPGAEVEDAVRRITATPGDLAARAGLARHAE